MRAKYVTLSEAEDKQLREIEQQSGLHEKVRLRAKILRLSQRGLKAQAIAAYTGRYLSSVLRDFARWETKGVAGLADGTIPGQRSPIEVRGARAQVFRREAM